MTLAARITAGALVLVVLATAHGAYQLSLIERLHGDQRALAETSFEAAGLSLEMSRRLEVVGDFSQRLFVVRDRGYAEELRRLRDRMEEDLARFEALDLTSGERREIEGFAGLWRPYAASARELEERVLEGARLDASREALGRTFEGLQTALAHSLEASRRALREKVEAGAARADAARQVARAASLLGLAAALALSWLLVRSVASPLRRLARGTRELAAGDFAHRVEESGIPELAAVARDFNSMADRLGELDRLKRDFLASVSHDLKAPLASIQETARLLLDGIPGPVGDHQRHLLELVLGSCGRLSAMIADLLDLARFDAGAMELEVEPQDLSAVCRAALRELEGLVRSRELRLETDFPARPVRVAGDEALLVRAVGNLLSNAAKLSPPGGALALRVRRFRDAGELAAAYRRRPGRARLPAAAVEVSDSGPGVPEEDREKIFIRFYRVPRRGAGQGTGLGLAIVRTIADAHGGVVWVEDAAADGSRFVLLLESSGGEHDAEERAD